MAHKLVLSAVRKVLHMIDSFIFYLFDKFIVKAEGFIEVTELISLMLLKLGAGCKHGGSSSKRKTLANDFSITTYIAMFCINPDIAI